MCEKKFFFSRWTDGGDCEALEKKKKTALSLFLNWGLCDEINHTKGRRRRWRLNLKKEKKKKLRRRREQITADITTFQDGQTDGEAKSSSVNHAAPRWLTGQGCRAPLRSAATIARRQIFFLVACSRRAQRPLLVLRKKKTKKKNEKRKNGRRSDDGR